MVATTKSYCLLVLLFVATSVFGGGLGEDLKNAPPGFDAGGKRAIPVDFQSSRLEITFDVAEKKALGKSRIEFFAHEEGYPMLDLVPEATSVRLNGQTAKLDLATPPGASTQLRVLSAKVAARSINILEVEYPLSSSDVTFTATGVRVGFFMSDVGEDRAFLEQYAPSNLEFDAFELETKLIVKGAGREHQLFTNGKVVDSSSGQWRIRFPRYFTTSSFFLHLTDKGMNVSEAAYAGLTKTIPITVYADTKPLSDDGLAKAKEVIKELEETYGPFAHEKAVIYVTAGGGGMEHCGATMTSLWALGHELTHSYFARGVMPANGNAGWIDEAVASWRDNSYPTASGAPTGGPINLGGFDVYRRTTPMAAYTDGARLMSVFDFLFKDRNGLKPVLRELYETHQHQVITTPDFESFLEEVTEQDLSKIFAKYVYNKAQDTERLEPSFLKVPGLPPMLSHHPRPYTREELVQLR